MTILCIRAISLVLVLSSSDVLLPLSVAEESAIRLFLVFFCLGLVIILGVVSGELSGLFWFGLPFGGVVSGMSVSCVGHNSVVSICGRSPYLLMSTVV